MEANIRKDKKEEIQAKTRFDFPKPILHFSGSTPPDFFVGKNSYPKVFSGILSPQIKGNTSEFSSPETWVFKNYSVEEIVSMRRSMVYARKISNIKKIDILDNVSQQIALASKPVSTEFFLEKKPLFSYSQSSVFPIIANPAPVKKIILEENPYIEKSVDYLTGDNSAKAKDSVVELYKKSIRIDHIQKLLSAGLLGTKKQRKLVPTRWSITAVDDSLSNKLIEKIKYYPELQEFRLFSDSYNGNDYFIILLPGCWNFEVIEKGLESSGFWTDNETIFKRKKYATSVTGAYYANRLAITEYLEKIKRQATVLVLREIHSSYYPLGVAILRELTRKAMQNKYENFDSFEDLFKNLKIKTSLNEYLAVSKILKNYGKQKKLSTFY